MEIFETRKDVDFSFSWLELRKSSWECLLAEG